MVVLRKLTQQEKDSLNTNYHGRYMSRQRQVILTLKPGDGILLSHEGLRCTTRACSIGTILALVKRITKFNYHYKHTNKQGSDVMVICVTRAE